MQSIALTYFEHVRSELDAVKRRAALVDEIDFIISGLLGLIGAAREGRLLPVGRKSTNCVPYLEGRID